MALPPNEKLTPLLAGRTVQAAVHDGDFLQLNLDDGSYLKIKMGGTPPAADALAGHQIKAVHQADTEMDLQFTDNSAAVIRLAEATSSVMLRDKDGNFQYSD